MATFVRDGQGQQPSGSEPDRQTKGAVRRPAMNELRDL